MASLSWKDALPLAEVFWFKLSIWLHIFVLTFILECTEISHAGNFAHMDFYLRKMVHTFSVNVNQNKTVCHLSLDLFNCRYNWTKNCQIHLLIKNFKSFLNAFGFNMVFWPKTYRKLDKTFSLEEILFKAEFFLI